MKNISISTQNHDYVENYSKHFVLNIFLSCDSKQLVLYDDEYIRRIFPRYLIDLGTQELKLFSLIEEGIIKAFHDWDFMKLQNTQLELFSDLCGGAISKLHSLATKSVYHKCANLMFVEKVNPLLVYEITIKIFSHPSKLRLSNSGPLESLKDFIAHARELCQDISI